VEREEVIRKKMKGEKKMRNELEEMIVGIFDYE
jgi:thymidine phosphorylase